MAEKDDKKEPTPSDEEKAAAAEEERAEAQRLLALRLQFGPIREPEED